MGSRHPSWTILSDRAAMSTFNPADYVRHTGRKRTYAEGENKDEGVQHPHTSPPKRARTSQPIPGRATNTNNPISISPKKSSPSKPKPKIKDANAPTEETRLRRFRPKPPRSYLEIKERALTQRFTVLSRSRCGTAECPEEKIVMAGTTGNVYTQHIRKIPHCDCPHANKGNQCKHLIYIMLRVLKVPEQIGIQLALLSSELRDIFQRAPPIPGVDNPVDGSAGGNEDGNRKPIEGDCPICYTEFNAVHETIVYCAMGCGNNVHKSCMQSWMRASHGKATCPYCRAKWEDEDLGVALGQVDLQTVSRNEEGYLNVASQLGLSGERDYSSYHEPWVRRRGYGRF